MSLKNVLPVYFQYSVSDPYVSNKKSQLSGNNSSVKMIYIDFIRGIDCPSFYNFTILLPSCGWDVNKTEVPCWEIATLSAR